jgi:hypothetical protein
LKANFCKFCDFILQSPDLTFHRTNLYTTAVFQRSKAPPGSGGAINTVTDSVDEVGEEFEDFNTVPEALDEEKIGFNVGKIWTFCRARRSPSTPLY